ncbi:MAG: transcriptional repressor [Candidatus Marinimicrobia bacterium]|nr:transcriptional repressor [Candidatus Neomarinimicrobiota bacterium]MCF7840614.1 transcriptional repressor [Candidatus Neomarinimicrobiota bacterium]MCF7902470.1 transcriptional repressor [Candidatus Neomarinimicrobiota bacterium]
MTQESPRMTLSSEEIRTELKRAGMRPTAQRLTICQYVLNQANHPSVEDIKAWVDDKFPGISLATVYNTVHALETAGLVQAIRFDHSDKVIYDSNTEPHFHFLDEDSGTLLDIQPEQVQINLNLPEDVLVNDISILIRGKRQ